MEFKRLFKQGLKWSLHILLLLVVYPSSTTPFKCDITGDACYELNCITSPPVVNFEAMTNTSNACMWGVQHVVGLCCINDNIVVLLVRGYQKLQSEKTEHLQSTMTWVQRTIITICFPYFGLKYKHLHKNKKCLIAIIQSKINFILCSCKRKNIHNIPPSILDLLVTYCRLFDKWMCEAVTFLDHYLPPLRHLLFSLDHFTVCPG